jgi:hypothetical protein
MSFLYKLNIIYLIICGLVSFIIILEIFTNPTDITLNENSGLKWNFMTNKNISINLGIMYFTIFFWIFTQSISNFIKYIGVILLSTFIFSYYLQSIKINSPSIWCMSSAIVAPLFLLY